MTVNTLSCNNKCKAFESNEKKKKKGKEKGIDKCVQQVMHSIKAGVDNRVDGRRQVQSLFNSELTRSSIGWIQNLYFINI